MLSLVRGEALSVEGTDLEQLVKKHEEYHVQIDRQLSKSQAVKEDGRRLVEGGNFMSTEVSYKELNLKEDPLLIILTLFFLLAGGGACL